MSRKTSEIKDSNEIQTRNAVESAIDFANGSIKGTWEKNIKVFTEEKHIGFYPIVPVSKPINPIQIETL